MIEVDLLNAEDLACAGLRLANDDWRLFLKENEVGQTLAALAPPAPSKRRVRRPSVSSVVEQLWRAAARAGVNVALTVEAGKVTATPVSGTAGAAASDFNEWDRELGTGQTEVRQ